MIKKKKKAVEVVEEDQTGGCQQPERESPGVGTWGVK